MQSNSWELFINLTLLFVRQNHIVWWLCALAFMISAVLIPIIIVICNKRKWYDSLDERKIHSGNIPRLGSIGFVTGFVVSAIIYVLIKDDAASSFIPFVLAGFIIFLFGIIDDFKNLRALFKLFVQIIAACIIVFTNHRFLRIGSFVIPTPFSWLLTMGWIIGVINSFNLIDGIDALCGGLSSLIAFTCAVIYARNAPHSATICLFLVASLLGFLLYNKPKAKIFMGDGGSQFLGFMIAALPLYKSSVNFEYNKFLVMLNLVAIPTIDCIAAIIRRLREHRGIMTPDRAHIHHKLMNIGFSSTQVLLLLLFVQALICLSCCIALYLQGTSAIIMLLANYAVIIVLFSVVHYLNRRALAAKNKTETIVS